MAKNTVGSVQYDASINLASLRSSLKRADTLVEQSYQKQTKNAQKASKTVTATSSKDARTRVDAVKKEASETARTISNYTPQIQRQFLTVERANNSVASATVRAQNAIQKFGADSVQASKATSSLNIAVQNQSQAQDRLQRMLNGTEKSTSGFSSAMTKAGAIAGSVAAVIGTVLNRAIDSVVNSFDSAIKRVDTLNNAPKVLKNLGFSAEDSAKATAALDKGIRGLPTSLDSATSALLAIASASGKSIDEATELTLAFNNMALAGGKGSQEASRALTQFTQALGRGKFQMQDFNTLAEVMPAQLNQVAKSLLGADANTRTLGTALSDGTLTIEQFNDKVVRLNKEGGSGFASFEKQAKDATKGIGTSFTNLQTSITRGVAGIIQSIGSDNISSAASAIGSALEGSLKIIGRAISAVIPIIKNFMSFIKDNSTALIALTATVAGAMLAYKAYGVAVGVVGAIQKAYTASTVALSAVMALQAQGLGVVRGAWLALNLAMAANPIGLVVAAVAGLVAGLVALSLATSRETESERLLREQREKSIQNAKALKVAEDDLKGARQSLEGASLRAERAQKTYNDTVAQYGSKSLEAREAAYNLKGAQEDLKTAQDKVKTSTKAVAEQVSNQRAEYDALNERLKSMDGKTFTYYLQGVEHVVQDYGKRGKYVVPTFATGGFTGQGGKYQPAGIVHAGEYVIPKEGVDQNTGLPKAGALGGTTNLTLNLGGMYFSSKSDKRAFATEIGKLINEASMSKLGKISIEGV